MNKLLFKQIAPLITIAFFLLQTISLSAQLSISTGYELSYHSPDTYGELLDRYNTSNSFLDDKLDQIGIMHGLQLGVRYDMEELVAFELIWKYRFDNSKASGTNPTTSEEVDLDLFVRQNVLSLGFENYYGWIGYGATIDYFRPTFKVQKTSGGSKVKVDSDSNFASTFFLSFNTNKNGQSSVSVRPYIQIPWTKVSLNALESELGESGSTEKIEEGFMNFGISFVFINGG